MKNLYFFTLVLFSSFHFSAQLVIANQGGTATAVVSAMVGGGLTVSNATINCPSNAYGTFTNGASTNLGIPSGIVLTTGNVNTLNGNGSTFWSANNGTFCSDPQIGSLEPLAEYDCCILEFDVVPSCTTLRIRFVFGSEEYPEWVSAGYNDAFGFFVTGQNPGGGNYNNTNVATLPNNTTIVSIDNVNANTNSAYYVNNSTGTSSVLDAFTTVLTRDVAVTPCQTYHFKLAIADAGDPIFDSGVFIDFLDCVNSVTSSTSTTPATCAGNDGTATANVSAGYPPYSYSWNTTPPQTTATATGLAPGTYTVTIDDAGSCTPPLTQTVTIGTSGLTTIPSFNQVAPICSGGSFSLPTISTNGITGTWSPSINNTATTSYTFTPAAGQCAGTSSMTVTVNPLVTPTFTQLGPFCQGSVATPFSNTSLEGINGVWGPPGINTGTVGTTNYVFVPNSGQCAVNQNMSITVNPYLTPTFTQQTPLCVGDNFVLASQSNNGIVGTWTPAINNTTTTTYTFSPAIGQCASNQTMTVVVGPPAVPTFNVLGPFCVGNTFGLPTSSLEGFTGTWSPAINNQITTTYTFTTTTGQCALNGTLEVIINPNPTIVINESPEICQGQSATLTASPSASGGTFLWTPGSNSSNTITVSPNATTVYAVVYTLNGCVSAPANSTVTVNPNIPVDGGQDIILCQGDSVTLTASGTPTASWSDGVQNGQSFIPSTSNSYVVTGTSANGCITTDTVLVTVNPSPVINAGNPQTVCVGQQVTLSGSGAGAGGTYSWSNGIQNNTPSTVNGTMTYTVTGTDANGCTSQAQVIVTGLPLPNANFSPDVTTGAIPLTVNFTNTSTNANSYTWDFGNGSGTNTLSLANTSTIYSEIGVYTAWLFASNGYCEDSTSTIININLPPWIFVPNVFTPNADGSNETWMVQTENMASIDLIILNRWGNVMAKIEDLNGGWDGKTSDGSNATAGTYFYKYEAKALNGEEFSGHGFLTLIR
jgi:gliding motility-associated-like protein